MKKIIFLLAIIAFKSYSQDTLRFKNGTYKVVKVTEITSGEVKYHRTDNPDGPLYVNYKSEIASVKYSNGQIDVFNEIRPQSPPVNTSAVVVAQSSVQNPLNDKIEIGEKKLYYNNRPLGESRMQRLIFAYPDDNKRAKLQESFNQMKSYKKKQYGLGFGFLGAAVGSFIVGMEMYLISSMSATSSSNEGFLAFGFIGGTTFGVTGITLSSIYKKKRIEKFRATTKLYNE